MGEYMVNTQIHTIMKTTNTMAIYIATKGITKHMSRDAAVTIWNALKEERWLKVGPRLVRGDDAFLFVKIGVNKIAVSHEDYTDKDQIPTFVGVMPKDRELSFEEVAS